MADYFDTPPQSSGSYTSTLGGAGTLSSFGSQSSGESQSTSQPVSVESRQTDWGLMQSALLQALGESQYNWAMQQYAKGEGVTDQTISNFMEMSGKGKGLADTLLHQYQDQISPLIDQYIREAGSYASEGRQRFEAGQAMSTQAQASTAAIQGAERQLQSMGINPNSGRYQDLLTSSRVADAAARAGAGTAAAARTEATGREMLKGAIDMGQKMPGQAMDAVKTSIGALTGAENAILGLMNAGANLAQSAAPFLQAAVAANKIPPTGQNAQSTSQQQSASQQPPPQSSSGGGGGSKAAPKEGGGGQGGGQKAPAGGGGKGDGKAAASPTIGDRRAPNRPQKDEKDEEEKTGTGAPEEAGAATGPAYFDPNTGLLNPEWTPDFGRDANGDLYTPETAPWNESPVWGAPMDERFEQPFNLGDPANSAMAAENAPLGMGNAQPPGEGTNWSNPFGNFDGQFNNTNNQTGGNFDDYDRGTYGDQGQQDFTGYDGGQDFNDFDAGTYGADYDPYGGNDFSGYDAGNDSSDFTDAGYDDNGYDPYGGYEYDAGDDTGDWTDSGGYDDSGYDYGDGGYEYDAGDDTGDWTDSGGYDDSGYDYGDGGYGYDAGDDTGDWTDSGGYDDSGYDDSGYEDYGSYDDGGYEDYGSYEDSGYDGGGYDYGGDYARGGAVRARPPQRPAQGRGVMPTTGGAVPRSASPSRGRQTDDISARLNAGEYVIPKDVVSHKGTEFFTKMIQNSRKLRTGMAGAKPKPTMRPALPQGTRPAFRSRPLPPR